MEWSRAEVKSILTRTSGYLKSVTSHSLQPYRGCPLGSSLCGVGCYVQHNRWLTRGRRWGSFLEARTNAAEAYLRQVAGERRWGRASRGSFGVFLSSSTEPFPPQERRLGITRRVLAAMLDEPPDVLVLQTHSPAVVAHLELVRRLAARCRLRVHLSIETDRERLPGLPPHASPVARRLAAAAALKAAGIATVVTVAPLLPIADPDAFFSRIAEVAGAVVIDHFIGGDGSRDGRRTRATPLVAAIAAVEPAAVELEYRQRMVEVARRYLPGRVGVSIDGFAGRYLS
ncbi:MAG: hypothetical protein D6696_09330 [Acidobacteria bacterium]|nr:MAG: hypothetical protein D6696_09330 [Acidobacteriota bacterium]